MSTNTTTEPVKVPTPRKTRTRTVKTVDGVVAGVPASVLDGKAAVLDLGSKLVVGLVQVEQGVENPLVTYSTPGKAGRPRKPFPADEVDKVLILQSYVVAVNPAHL